MGCRILKTPGFTMIMCDEPYIGGPRWIEFMVAQCARERREEERELDIERQLELYPLTEMEAPDIVPAELVLEWNAYEGRA